MAEVNINDFLTRISSSKQDFNGCWNNFLVIKDNKEIFDALHTTAYEAKDNFFSADGCPDGFWRIQLSLLTAAVYYSDFAQQIIKNAAVSDWNYNLI